MESLKQSGIVACAFGLVLLGLRLFGVSAQAATQHITPLFTFPCTNSGICSEGTEPNWIIQASDENFYGVTGSTSVNGIPSNGTIFKITPTGEFTLLHSFQSTNDNTVNPATSLVEGNDGFIYGTSLDGGDANQGVLFRISKSGTGFEIVHSFCSEANCSDGLGPSSLILAHDGNLYGVAGTNASGSLIFRFSSPASFSIVRSFPSNGAPFSIIQGADGNFYATAIGTLNQVERISPSGQITVLGQIQPQGFDPCHGETPLLQAADGNLWGMMGCYQIEQAQFFKVALSGGLKEFPRLGHSEILITPIQASNGDFWSVETGLNEVIEASPDTGTVIQSFPFTAGNGNNSEARVVQGADGKIYGTATGGGTGQTVGGTVWVLNVGLAAPQSAIAAFSPAEGAAGAEVLVRGDHFIGTTAVSFNGTAATFHVLNRNFILATVPTDATTGPIVVTNAGGTTTSQENFTVQ